jgi:hypothetical protein
MFHNEFTLLEPVKRRMKNFIMSPVKLTEGDHGTVINDGMPDIYKFFAEHSKTGGKLLTYVGTNDQLIMLRGVIHYYRQMASHYGSGNPDFEELKSFYRLFRAPGVGHCGGGAGPQLQNAFEALVDWVENGKAPEMIPAQTKTRGGEVTRSRPLCPYPQTAICNGSGSTDDAGNFHCNGNLETPEIVCRDVLVKYKEEASGSLDYSGTGVNQRMCAK